MRASPEVFITCALTGNSDTVGKHPGVPVTPQQIADDAIRAARAGAAIVHCHVRDPITKQGSMDVSLYRELVQRIRASSQDVIINLTGGPGGKFLVGPNGADDSPLPGSEFKGPIERIAFLEELRPEICTIDCGTMSFGDENFVYIQPPTYLRRAAQYMKDLGVKAELEIFDTGQLWFAEKMIAQGLIPGPPLLQLCMGVANGAPQDLNVLTAMIARLPKDAVFTSFGLGRHQMPMVAQSFNLGGNIRVGLEDNLFLERGKLATNEILVERAVNIVELLGGTVMGPAEVRKRLGLVAYSG